MLQLKKPGTELENRENPLDVRKQTLWVADFFFKHSFVSSGSDPTHGLVKLLCL